MMTYSELKRLYQITTVKLRYGLDDFLPDDPRFEVPKMARKSLFWIKNRIRTAEAASKKSAIDQDKKLADLLAERGKRTLAASVARLDTLKASAISRRQLEIFRITYKQAQFEVDAIARRIDRGAAQRGPHTTLLQAHHRLVPHDIEGRNEDVDGVDETGARNLDRQGLWRDGLESEAALGTPACGSQAHRGRCVDRAGGNDERVTEVGQRVARLDRRLEDIGLRVGCDGIVVASR